MSTAGGMGPQVTHRAEAATAVAATRSLIGALRTADAPVDVLEHATALVAEATELLAAHGVDGIAGAERAPRRPDQLRGVRHR